MRYRVALPPGTLLLSLNDRIDKTDRVRRTIIIRETARRIADGMSIPRMEKVHVRGIYHYPDNRRRDPGNLAPTMKAMIDGALDQVIPDDSDEYLSDHGISRGLPNVTGALFILEIMPAEGVIADYQIDVKGLFLKGKL